MQIESLTRRITVLLSAVSAVPPTDITAGKVLTDLGVDSVKLTALVTLIEAEYGCELSPEQIIGLFAAVRFEDLVTLVAAAIP